MESLRVALARPTSLFKGSNDEEFESLCLFNIQKKGTGKNPIPLLVDLKRFELSTSTMRM